MIVIAVLLAAAVPAAILLSRRTPSEQGGQVATPFCSLPADVRALLAAGYTEGRSPDLFGVTVGGGPRVVGGADAAGSAWPSTADGAGALVPIAFGGYGVADRAVIPDGTALADVAPTIASIIGLQRAYPEVRSGEAIAGVADGRVPRLVLLVALRGLGAIELPEPGRWNELGAHGSSVASTTAGLVGSLPLDPAAVLTTIGTGATPAEHGVPSALIRDGDGTIVGAWSDGAPTSIVATLGDDLDAATAGASIIGIVETTPSDRGLIGGTWYPGADDDLIRIASGPGSVRAARDLLDEGMGRDDVVDLLAVVLDDGPDTVDARVAELWQAARRAVGEEVLVVVVGTGSAGTASSTDVDVATVVSAVDDAVPAEPSVIAATVVGGSFLDREAMGAAGVNGTAVAEALRGVAGPTGAPLFADTYQGFAVSFGRYC